jgi:hypothetical protein
LAAVAKMQVKAPRIDILGYWLEALSSLVTLIKDLPIRTKTLIDMKSKLNRLWNDLR